MADTKNYKILEITFSVDSDVDRGPAEGAPQEERLSPQKHTRTTTLTAHASYSYRGFYNEDEYGTVVVELSEICSVSINENGNLTSFVGTSADEIKLETVMEKITAAIEEQINSTHYRAAEKTHIDSFLNKVRSLEGLPTKYTKSGRPNELWSL